MARQRSRIGPRKRDPLLRFDPKNMTDEELDETLSSIERLHSLTQQDWIMTRTIPERCLNLEARALWQRLIEIGDQSVIRSRRFVDKALMSKGHRSKGHRSKGHRSKGRAGRVAPIAG